MQLYLALFFSIATLISIGLVLGPTRFRVPPRPELYGPLTLVLITIVALLAPIPVAPLYKAGIVLGLLLALLAEVMRTLPGTPPAVSQAFLLLTYFVYLLAFAGPVVGGWPSPWGLLIPLYGGLLFWQLDRRQLAELQGSIIGIGVLLGLVTWQALELWTQTLARWAGFGLLGVLLIVIANSVLAWIMFRKPWRYGHSVALVAYYLGQLVLAWSVWGLL